MNARKPPIQVIERAGHLLDAIARHGEAAVTLKVLSAESGLHPSTAFRILSSLVEIGFVHRDDAGRYALGAKLQQLGSRVRTSVDIREEAKPIMSWLRDQVGETVNLTVREGDEMVYVERASPARMMRVERVIGSRAPMHVTAVGKLMLGEDEAVRVAAYAKRTGLPAFTEKTHVALASLQEDIGLSKARGYALDNEETESGVGCIGVLVRDMSGEAVAGLSISFPIDRRKTEWIPVVQEAGRRLSERLGYRQP